MRFNTIFDHLVVTYFLGHLVYVISVPHRPFIRFESALCYYSNLCGVFNVCTKPLNFKSIYLFM